MRNAGCTSCTSCTRCVKRTNRANYARFRRGGFTLIELMIVVAIVGVLAAIAIPQYQDYVARAQFTEALSLISGQKAPLAEFYSEKGYCPDNSTNSVGGIPAAPHISGKYVTSVKVVPTTDSATPDSKDSKPSCSLVATFADADISVGLKGQFVTVAMQHIDRGPISWKCSTTVLQRYAPQTCDGKEKADAAT